MGLAHVTAAHQADSDFRHWTPSRNADIATGCKIGILDRMIAQALFERQPLMQKPLRLSAIPTIGVAGRAERIAAVWRALPSPGL
jgi:hypothetical protein